MNSPISVAEDCERLLDEALAMTFPASDPVAINSHTTMRDAKGDQSIVSLLHDWLPASDPVAIEMPVRRNQKQTNRQAKKQ